MTSGRIISEEEFAEELRSFRISAFRLETREHYAVTFERDAFLRFLDGSPMPPQELDWWQSWLDEMRELTRHGKTIGRVRVLSDPPSDYQRWEMWGTPWHTEAGEQIRYLPQREANAAGIPLTGDWWLLDEERLIIMEFTSNGEPATKTLTTDPMLIAEHCAWRDLAVRRALTAEQFAAA
jgi:hypothetical protein